MLTMQSTLTPHDELLSRALLVAISTIADFDESLPTGSSPVVPEVIIWMMEQTNQALMLTLNDGDLRPVLSELIADYGKLRRHALSFQAFRGRSVIVQPSGYSEFPVRIIFDDLEAALDIRDAPVGATFKSIFSSIIPGVRRRLEEMDTIEWGDHEPIPAANDDVAAEAVCIHQTEYEFFRAAMVEPYLGDDPVETVVDFMMQGLVDEDFGRHTDYWLTVDISVLMRCAELDLPIDMARVAEDGRMEELKAVLLQELDVMRETEQGWRELGAPLRSLLATSAGPRETMRIIKTLLEAHDSTSSRSNNHIGVYWMFCRRLGPTFDNAPSLLPLPLDNAPHIDSIRHDIAATETCYLVDTADLFGSPYVYTSNKHCLVIRLPEPWLQLQDTLSANMGIQRIVSQSPGGSEFRLNLTPNRAFWAPEEKLLPYLYRFARRLPVVYVFESCCLLANYKFNRFVDLQKVIDTPLRHLPGATIEEGEWRYHARDYLTALPDGTLLKPVILSEVRDLTSNVKPEASHPIASTTN
ncbi:hypothetical protein B0G81_2214 [Paraburkholderia sp. BL6665CI2N2]|uniref:hypothetical protein n=1 Tax=Paraburkholderia sp. BL6665CI2N2 TaxID=1938806 RepID=UPI001065A010|nr:hypothetical protein [Paraburkholderia sp. BL6665CI2N2]TDY21967.1 hypothetical protein B0G81_2214 [Paraburkholderia sp. BL6665CI2N2]